MYCCTRFIRGVAALTLAVFVQSLVLPALVQAQTAPCTFNKEKPSLDNARLNFRITNYACAEEELQALLAIDTLNLQSKADAHVLLAAVFYAKVRNSEEKRNRVMEQFVAAFKAFRDWRGELDIKSPEFAQMLSEAQTQVDREAQAPQQPSVSQADTTKADTLKAAPPVIVQKETAPKAKKAWYKQWWAIGLGVGVVVVAVAVLAGGGGSGDETTPAEPLPNFPPTP
jgi:hypothetical protein